MNKQNKETIVYDILFLIALMPLGAGIYMNFGLGYALIVIGAILCVLSLILAQKHNAINKPIQPSETNRAEQ